MKGAVAIWARENLEEAVLPSSPVARYLDKVSTSRDREQEDYRKGLPDCQFVIQAIGYSPNELPSIKREGERLGGNGHAKTAALLYDHVNGGFVDAKGEKVRGLYGAGIAWPERVVDPEGNVEFAVGLWKFMNYLKKVVPKWGKD